MAGNQSQLGYNGLLDFLCDHLVSLAGTYVAQTGEAFSKVEKEDFFALPGFIMAMGTRWCLITAGHTIEELENGLTDGTYRLTNCCLAAGLGSKSASAQA